MIRSSKVDKKNSAAGLEHMDFPALRKNPFLATRNVIKRLSSVGIGESGEKKIITKFGNSNMNVKRKVLNLSPVQCTRTTLTVKSRGMTSCFTSDTIEKLLEENPYFACIGENQNTSQINSRNSAQEGAKLASIPEIIDQGKESNIASRADHLVSGIRSNLNKLKSSDSRDKGSISKGGSHMKSINTRSPLRSMKVYHDFMKDI